MATPYKRTDRRIRPRGDTRSKIRPSQQEQKEEEEGGAEVETEGEEEEEGGKRRQGGGTGGGRGRGREGGRRRHEWKRKSRTEDKGVEAYIHVDDRLIGTIDGGEQGVGATGVEGQQRRRVAGVWTSVPSVVPCCTQCSCTLGT